MANVNITDDNEQPDDLMMLEIRYERKLEEYKQAEEAGMPQPELNILYQKIKELRVQLELSKRKPGVDDAVT